MIVTPLYAGALALWFLALSLKVVRGRVGHGNPSLGDGGIPRMQRMIRGHGNFAEYTPLILLLMALLELGGQPRWALHAIGGTLLLGRLLHGYALSFTRDWPLGRTAGIALTFIALLSGGAWCLYIGLRGL